MTSEPDPNNGSPCAGSENDANKWRRHGVSSCRLDAAVTWAEGYLKSRGPYSVADNNCQDFAESFRDFLMSHKLSCQVG